MKEESKSGQASDLNRRYTYADYLTWPDGKRRELVNGSIRVMPSPGTRHQEALGELFGELRDMVKQNKEKYAIFLAPFDVRLPKSGEKEDHLIQTVVQPDICVIGDLSKLDERGCLGAPDLVVEIHSHSTSKYDQTEKFNLYEASGVREYWIVFPGDKAVHVFVLQPNGKYDEGAIYESGKVPVHIFDGTQIDLDKVFDFKADYYGRK